MIAQKLAALPDKAFEQVALRQLGAMLQETPKAKGGQPYQATGSKSAPVEPTLADLGLDKKTSAIAQKLAALPDKAFEQVIL